MFEFVEGNECFWPVKLPRVNDAGEVEQCEVLVRYRIYTRTEMKTKRLDVTREVTQRMAAAVSAGDAAGANTALSDMAAMEDERVAEVRERITGWKGITRNGDEAPFSLGLLDKLLDDEARFNALRAGLFEASRGARAKN